MREIVLVVEVVLDGIFIFFINLEKKNNIT